MIRVENGKRIKFTLNNDLITADLRSHGFLKSFVFKGNFFCVYDFPNWLIFDSQEMLSLFQDSEEVFWRFLDSGRIKGDIYSLGKKRTILTFEYRAEAHKKQFVFGAHGGGAGEKLKNLLKSKLFFNSIPVDYELWR